VTYEAVVVNLIGAGHYCDAKIGHQICNTATRSTMAAPFTRLPSRSTRGTTVEISTTAESHRHYNRGRESAPSSFSHSWFLVSSSYLLVIRRSGADDGLQWWFAFIVTTMVVRRWGILVRVHCWDGGFWFVFIAGMELFDSGVVGWNDSGSGLVKNRLSDLCCEKFN